MVLLREYSPDEPPTPWDKSSFKEARFRRIYRAGLPYARSVPYWLPWPRPVMHEQETRDAK